MSLTLELIRFTLPSSPTSSASAASSASNFAHPRHLLSTQTQTHHGVRTQHVGYAFRPPAKSAVDDADDDANDGGREKERERENSIEGVEWPTPPGAGRHANLNSRAGAVGRQLRELIAESVAAEGLNEDEGKRGEEGKGPASLLFEFEDAQAPELVKALEAPVCEVAIINLSSTEPRQNADFEKSMHKAFTDCYRIKGFRGGHWGYAVNTNDSKGFQLGERSIHGEAGPWVDEKDRRLACYWLGWESVEAHQAASDTEIYAEEMSKLRPWFGEGTGMWYVRFERGTGETSA